MSESWRGLYLKAERKHVADAVRRLAISRGYSMVHYEEALSRQALEDIWDAGLEGRLDTLETIFALTVNDQWTRLIGLDFADAAHPRLFYTYELVMLLGCDAFECGFIGRAAWWYSYFERGLIKERFCSNPWEALDASWDDLWGADDPRLIYGRCIGVRDQYKIRSLPVPVQQQLRGDPKQLAPILKPSGEQQLTDVLQEELPERAIERLSQVIELPYIGEYWVSNFLSDLHSFRLRGEPVPDWITNPIEQGVLAFVMLRHPKHILLQDVEQL
jgi:hypothetical protein